MILRPGVKLTNIVTVDDVIERHSKEKYSEILAKSREYEMMDPYFRVSKECMFIDNIIKYRLDWKLHEAVDHVYFWNNVRPLGRLVQLEMYMSASICVGHCGTLLTSPAPNSQVSADVRARAHHRNRDGARSEAGAAPTGQDPQGPGAGKERYESDYESSDEGPRSRPGHHV